MSSTKNNETIVDILAEYRADTLEMAAGHLYQPTTEYLRRLLDRLEAAWKRERAEIEDIAKSRMLEGTIIVDNRSCGNAAALRKALLSIRKALLVDSGMGPHTAFHNEVDRLTAEALSAPARNCDRFETAEEAMEYHKRTNCAKRRYCAYRDGCPTDGSCLVNYLFATATISKGDTDGSK